MKVVVATTQVPFVRGGAEIHAENLVNALKNEGHQAEIVAIPFKWYPPEKILDTMLVCRLLDLSESCGQKIDKLITLKFPAYLIPHSNKVVWLLHQHRQAYELWGTALGDLEHFPNGIQVRQAIINADNKILKEKISLYANSINVTKRLKKYNQIDAIPLYHPPHNAELLYCKEYGDYFFFPSRLNPTKRQFLAIEALAKTKNNFRVIFTGNSDNNEYNQKLLNLAKELGVKDRVSFLGTVSETEKIEHYARCLGVIYPPFEEDYGYVTLEAMLASKPVITCIDSGGPTEFIENHKTGLIVESNPESIAAAMDELWENVSFAKLLGKAGKDYYKSLNINWSNVITQLLK
ncbi:glycosyltransferase family 4 protein [Myxosarcina sp. GI1(2024)]